MRSLERVNIRTNVRTYVRTDSHTYVRDRPYIPSTTLLCEGIKTNVWLLIFHFFMFDRLNFYQSIAKVRHCYSSHTGKTSALKKLKLSLRYKKKYL